jgi:hypothetical protein
MNVMRLPHGAALALTGRCSEHIRHDERERPVEHRDQRHHDHNEDQHDTRVAQEFLARGRDDLAEFGHDLLDEQGQPSERTALGIAGHSCVGDDFLTGFVDNFSGHLLHLSWAGRNTTDLQGGQDSNLQPAVLETAALPIEPPPYGAKSPTGSRASGDLSPKWAQKSMADFNYLDQV